MRADALDGLTEAGWAAVASYGVRTIVDLRNDDELGPDVSPRPASVETVRLPLDGVEDRGFWDAWDSGPQFGTPLYYGPHLEHFPERSAAVVAAVARAPAGGVVVHCGSGRDRAGQVSLLLLALAGVEPEEIAADYELSAARVAARRAARGEPDERPVIDEFLAERGTTASELMTGLATDLDAEAFVRAAGLSGADVAAVRARLLDP